MSTKVRKVRSDYTVRASEKRTRGLSPLLRHHNGRDVRSDYTIKTLWKKVR